MRFRLISGVHYGPVIDKDGKRTMQRHVKGDVVESEEDLDVILKGKFSKLPDSPEADVKTDANKTEGELAEENEETPGPDKLVAVHAGHGRYNVVRADTDEKINDKTLSKAAAVEMAGGRIRR